MPRYSEFPGPTVPWPIWFKLLFDSLVGRNHNVGFFLGVLSDLESRSKQQKLVPMIHHRILSYLVHSVVVTN